MPGRDTTPAEEGKDKDTEPKHPSPSPSTSNTPSKEVCRLFLVFYPKADGIGTQLLALVQTSLSRQEWLSFYHLSTPQVSQLHSDPAPHQSTG
jgi:hypothetical protein